MVTENWAEVETVMQRICSCFRNPVNEFWSLRNHQDKAEREKLQLWHDSKVLGKGRWTRSQSKDRRDVYRSN